MSYFNFKTPVSSALPVNGNAGLVIREPSINMSGGYTLVQNVHSSPQPLHSDLTTLPVSPSEKSEKLQKPLNLTIDEFHSLLYSQEHKFGEPESMLLKQVRPFLYSNEVSSATIARSAKSSGKNKGKKNKPSKEVTKAYTFSNPVPAAMNYTAANKAYKFTQEYLATSFLTTSTTVPSFQAKQFNVNDLDQISSLTSVFDQYKIDFVEVWLECSTASTANLLNGTQDLITVVDYDDATNLSTINSALDYTNALATPLGQNHYRKFQPHAAVAAYSGTFVSFSNVSNIWIDAGSPGVQHYGFKAIAGITSTATSYNLRVRYHTSWRNVR